MVCCIAPLPLFTRVGSTIAGRRTPLGQAAISPEPREPRFAARFALEQPILLYALAATPFLALLLALAHLAAPPATDTAVVQASCRVTAIDRVTAVCRYHPRAPGR
jgi:hypothetical protein